MSVQVRDETEDLLPDWAQGSEVPYLLRVQREPDAATPLIFTEMAFQLPFKDSGFVWMHGPQSQLPPCNAKHCSLKNKHPRHVDPNISGYRKIGFYFSHLPVARCAAPSPYIREADAVLGFQVQWAAPRELPQRPGTIVLVPRLQETLWVKPHDQRSWRIFEKAQGLEDPEAKALRAWMHRVKPKGSQLSVLSEAWNWFMKQASARLRVEEVVCKACAKRIDESEGAAPSGAPSPYGDGRLGAKPTL